MAVAAGESRYLIDGDAGDIEVVFTEPKLEGALATKELIAVVCHPHPLHGGTMDNKVVSTLVRSYRDLGVPVVRFNFRGVGASDGEHDNAVGEVDDLLAVIEWAQAQRPSPQLLLAGFSFGSAVAAQGAHFVAAELAHLVLVAPPVERYPYDREGKFPASLQVIIGGEDELIDVPGVQRWSETLNTPVDLLLYPKAGHFFHGYLVELRQDLMSTLDKALS